MQNVCSRGGSVIVKKMVERYLGDEGLALAKSWYEYTLREEWNFVAFIVRRAYLLAQIMEDATEEQMESDGSTVFLTDAALFSQSDKLALYFINYGILPNILICEDCLIHGRNINHFVESFSNEIWTYVQEKQAEANEEDFRDAFARAIQIHVMLKPDDGLLILERYALRVHSCATKSVKQMHEFSYGLSQLIAHSGKANAAYVYSEMITSGKYLRLKELEEFSDELLYTTIYNGITEYSREKFVLDDDKVKAILTIRVNSVASNKHRIIPFVFLPDLTEIETTNLWTTLKQSFIECGNNEEIIQEYLRYMEQLKDLDGMRSFNEWITLILSQMWLSSVYNQAGIRMRTTSVDDYRILAGNYNITGLVKTKKYLKCVIDTTNSIAKCKDKMFLEKILLENIDQDNYLVKIDKSRQWIQDTDSIKNEVEGYWYNIAAREEKEARSAVGGFDSYYEEAVKKVTRNTHHLGEMIGSLFRQKTTGEIGLGIAYLLQMMDAGMVGVSSYASKSEQVLGFTQYAKAGEMSLLIYPKRMKKYLPFLARIYNYCIDMGLEWYKTVIDFCNSVYSDMNPEEVEKIEKFVSYLYDNGLNPDEWNIYYGDEVTGNGDSKEYGQMNRKIALVMNSYKYLNGCEQYIDNVLLGQ